jgi:hypothetical protein
MTTKELINYLKLNAEGWNRDGERGLLPILNEAQNILMMQEAAGLVAYTESGDLPVIETSQGTRRYSVNQSLTGLSYDVWRVADILIKTSSSADRNFTEYGGSVYEAYTPPTQIMVFNGVEYVRFHQIAYTDAVESGYPELIFRKDPGDTTESYYLLSFKKPTQLVSELIPLSMPSHLHMTLLFPVAMKLVEAHQNNNWIEAFNFIEEFKKRAVHQLSNGSQGEDYTTTRWEV